MKSSGKREGERGRERERDGGIIGGFQGTKKRKSKQLGLRWSRSKGRNFK